MTTNDEALQMASRASQILRDEGFTMIVDLLEDRIHEEWEMNPDANVRNELWHRLKALKMIVGQMQALVDSGKVAQAIIDEQNKQLGLHTQH